MKFIFRDNQGRFLHAGGLLLYDDSGIWVIKEYYRNGYKLIDPGGKYCFQDCDIINTIWREFCEETYFILDNVPLSKLKDLITDKKAKMIYVCPDNTDNPTYACLLVNTKDLNLTLDGLSEKFIEKRNRALINNPLVPQNYFTSFELCYIPYADLRKYTSQFHYRLKQIFINSFINKYLIQ